MIKKVKCPQCGKQTEYSKENPWRPFCSERCRLIDLGQWADEKYRVPIQNQSDPSDISQSAQDVSGDDAE
jgi:hypothetical protein